MALLRNEELSEESHRIHGPCKSNEVRSARQGMSEKKKSFCYMDSY